jgi:TonB-linked SusC/RagA family outer membrane protein
MKKKFDLWVHSNPILKKLIMELKIAILFIVVGVSNVLATPTYSQVAKVSLDIKNRSLEQVMDEIESQSEFYFIFNQKQIDVNRVVDIQAENKLITDILPELFKETNVNYVVFDRKILLTTDPLDNYLLAIASEPEPQQKQITGTITDATTGEALAGVNIQVKGTTTGTISDVNGKYSISSAVDQNTILVFSFIGYTTQEVPVAGKIVINVAFTSDVTDLNEVVIVGYGSVKKATMTGSIIAVKGDKIQVSPAPNLTNTLAGRLPGLVTVNYSGEPGRDDATLRIRGVNTLGDNSPLIVIDGVANRRLADLNPTVIESITVLKDASAAIYGAQAANGVILITTKRGSLGKPQININYNQGLSMPTVLPKMCDAATFATLLNEINSYRGQLPSYTAEEIQKFRDGSDPWLYPNTDWVGEVFKSSAQQNFGDISLSGGIEKIKYLFSSSYDFQDNIFKNSIGNYSKGNFRANIDADISDNIHLSIDLSGTQENKNFTPYSTYSILATILGTGGGGPKPFQVAWYPGHKPAAGFEAGKNPAAQVTDIDGYDRSKTYSFLSNIKLLVTIPWVKGLSVTGYASYDKDWYNQKIWLIP